MSPIFLIIAVVLFALWLLLILISKNTRQEQIVMSIVGLGLAPAIVALAMQSGTGLSRQFGVEDFLFALGFFGVAAVIYEVLFARHFVAGRLAKPVRHPVFAWITRLLLCLCVWVAVSVACIFILQLSTLRAMLAGALLVGVYIIADRKDLLANALVSGAFMAALVFLCDVLFGFRFYPSATASTLLIVSPETIVWSAIAGFAIGPLYEYVRHLKVK